MSVEPVIELGFCDTLEQLKAAPAEHDRSRHILEVTTVLDASRKYQTFLRNLISAKIKKGPHVSTYRTAILSIDEKTGFRISANPSPMWRFSWAQAGAQKSSDLVQFALRTVKRSGVPRHPWLEQLQVLYRSIHLGQAASSAAESDQEELPEFPLDDDVLEQLEVGQVKELVGKGEETR